MGMARWISYAAVIILAIGSVGLAKAPSAKAVGDNSPLAKQLKRHSESAKEKAKRLEAMRSSLSEQKKQIKIRLMSRQVRARNNPDTLRRPKQSR